MFLNIYKINKNTKEYMETAVINSESILQFYKHPSDDFTTIEFNNGKIIYSTKQTFNKLIELLKPADCFGGFD